MNSGYWLVTATQTLSVSHSLDSSPEGRAFYPSAALRAPAPLSGEPFAVRRIGSSPSQSPAVTALPKGEPLAKPEALPYCQSLSPRERWLRPTGADREGEDAALNYAAGGLHGSLPPLGKDSPAPGEVARSARRGTGVEEQSDETDEGAPLDGANGYSPLIRHFVPPSPKGEGFSGAAKLAVSTKTSPLGRGGFAQQRRRGSSPKKDRRKLCGSPLVQVLSLSA